MSKYRRKRTQAEYEQEMVDAANRIKKKKGKEAIKAARNTPEWLNFLNDIGVLTDNKAKQDFWEDVRRVINPPPVVPSTPEIPVDYERAKVTVDKNGHYHDIATGRFKSKAYTRNVSYFSERRLAEVRVSIDQHGRFRDNETGKYVSKQTIEKRY